MSPCKRPSSDKHHNYSLSRASYKLKQNWNILINTSHMPNKQEETPEVIFLPHTSDWTVFDMPAFRWLHSFYRRMCRHCSTIEPLADESTDYNYRYRSIWSLRPEKDYPWLGWCSFLLSHSRMQSRFRYWRFDNMRDHRIPS